MAEDVKGFSIKLGLDTTEFQSGIKNLNKDLASQKQALSKVNGELKYNSGDVDTWKKKQALLTSTIADTTSKLDLQNEHLAQMREQLKVGAVSEDEFKRFQKEVLSTEKQLNSLNNQLAATTTKIAALSKVDFAGITNIGTSLTKNLTAPLVAAATAISALTVSTANAVDEMGDNAEKAGVTAEEYQKLTYAAEIMAVDMTQLQKALVKVNAVMGDVAVGNAEGLSDSLALIGLTVSDLEGLGTEEVFNLLRDSLSDVEDEATRMAIANEVFGDTLGTELLPLLSLEADAFTELKDAAVELGIATNEQVALAGEFTDKIVDLKMSLSNVAYTLMEGVIPILTQLADFIQENLVPKLKGLVESWNALDETQQKNILIAASVVAAIGPVIVIVGKLGTLLQTLPTIISVITGKTALFGITLNASTAGIAALVAVISTALLTNEEFKQSLSDIISLIGDALTPLIEVIADIFKTLSPTIQLLASMIAKLVVALMPLIEVALMPTLNLLQLLAPLLTAMTPLLELMVIPVTVLSYAFEALLKVLEPIFELMTKISELSSNIFSGISETMGNLFGNSSSTTSNTTNNTSTTNNVSVSATSVDASYIDELLGGLV